MVGEVTSPYAEVRVALIIEQEAEVELLESASRILSRNSARTQLTIPLHARCRG